MVKTYIPRRGDIVQINFDPQAGHEQAGRRPALVISPTNYNQKTGLAICCTITSKIKGYPFEVQLSGKQSTHGVILADHLKSLDWQARQATFLEKCHPDSLNECLLKAVQLLVI